MGPESQDLQQGRKSSRQKRTRTGARAGFKRKRGGVGRDSTGSCPTCSPILVQSTGWVTCGKLLNFSVP